MKTLILNISGKDIYKHTTPDMGWIWLVDFKCPYCKKNNKGNTLSYAGIPKNGSIPCNKCGKVLYFRISTPLDLLAERLNKISK